MNVLDCTMGTNEAAKLSGYSAAYIKDSCANGKIKAKKVGTSWVIDRRLFNLSKPDTNDHKVLMELIISRIVFTTKHGTYLNDAIDEHMRSHQLSVSNQLEILERLKTSL